MSPFRTYQVVAERVSHLTSSPIYPSFHPCRLANLSLAKFSTSSRLTQRRVGMHDGVHKSLNEKDDPMTRSETNTIVLDDS